MSNVFYKPWVGAKYKSSKPRIMLLGESVYGDVPKEEGSEFVINMINAVYTQTWCNPYFTKVTNLLNQLNISWAANEFDCWGNLLFYEYVQEPLDSARVRPTTEQWEKSEIAFEEILNEYKPQLILVLGKELYKRLPELNGDIQDNFKYKYNGKEFSSECWKYNVNNKDIYVLEVQHPSSGFSYEPWVKMINKMLSLI